MTDLKIKSSISVMQAGLQLFSTFNLSALPPHGLRKTASLIADKSKRTSTLDEVKKHPFYAGIPWDSLRDTAAPFIPALDSEIDTGYFVCSLL